MNDFLDRTSNITNDSCNKRWNESCEQSLERGTIVNSKGVDCIVLYVDFDGR